MSGKRRFFFLILTFFLVSTSVSLSWEKNVLSGRVTRVSDGDTIWVRLDSGRRVKVRVWGIDTPEKFPSKKLAGEARRCGVFQERIKRLGRLASERVKELLDHHRIKLIPRGRCYYGRLLALIILPDGTDFGELMIEEGFACVYRKNTKDSYRRAEYRARRDGKGFWGIDPAVMECLCF